MLTFGQMKLLKVLLNSLISGLFFSALLALLLYDLNINTPFQLVLLEQMTLFFIISYGLVIFIFSFLGFFIIQFISGKKITIFYISPSFLSISFSIIIFLFLIIFRTNYDYFVSFFSPSVKILLQKQLISLFMLALVGILLFYFYIHRKKPALMVGYFLFFILGISFAVYQRSIYPLPHTPQKVANLEVKEIQNKVTIIGLNGLSFDFIIPLINEQKLPNFSWLMKEGSWGRLHSFTPSDSIVLRSSLYTGKLPYKHRRISSYKYQLLHVDKKIEVVPRYIFFRQLSRLGLLQIAPCKPPFLTKNIWKIFQDSHISFLVKDNQPQNYWKNPSSKTETLFNFFYKDLKFESSKIFQLAAQSFYSDCEFEQEVMQEKNRIKPQLLYFSLSGLNVVEAYFYKYSFPDLYGYIEQEEINKFSGVIDKYYQFYDQIIGKHLTSLKENELLIIYSPYGVESLPVWKRFIEWLLGNPDISAYHELAPEGVVFFYGNQVAKENYIEGTKLLDIVPTVLYYLGLHVGLDMDGVAKTSVFKEGFRAENPVPYISSYDVVNIKSSQ